MTQPLETQTAGHAEPNYLAIFGALCLLTGLSVVADILNLPGGKIVLAVIVLAIATAKATFVMMYFMHLKYERAWKYALLLPTVILAIGLLIALMPDISLHYYPLDIPQLRSQNYMQ